MIPILYDTNETSFTSNGLGRLRDCIECKVTEERNGVYEADFQYPVSGANFDKIRVGRIIGVTHNESEDIQPFDIVSYEKPINGVVTFHCTHISYRQSYMTVTGSNINSLADAFTLLGNAEPTNPFTYQTDKTSSAYMSGADGKPKSVRSLLGGTEGSILDTYGGEYEWDKFRVILHDSRGETRPFSIRYGVNMLEYNEDFDTQGSYSSCIPFWSNGTDTVVGDRQFAAGVTIANRGECIPLDVSDKFESKPSKADVEAMGVSVMASKNVYNPTQTLHVEFARLQDVPDYENFRRLYQCNICDTINVVFPDYKSTGQFKIVKTVWDVLKDRYDSMELGDLSISLSQALGVNSSSSYSGSSGGGGGGGDVTGVKGNAEGSYRTGNVNLTPANIGAVPTSRTVNGKALSSDISLTASDVSALSTSSAAAGITSTDITNWNAKSDFSGSYTDLTDKPTLGTASAKDYTTSITASTDLPTATAVKDYVEDYGVFYGTCSTAKGTVTKTTTISGVTELATGLTIAVKFTNENTSSNPKLKVNSLDAKSIVKYGSTAPGTTAAGSWQAGSVVTMTYDGTRWVMHDWNNTTYSSMTVAEYEAGTGTTARVITPARLKGAIQYWDAVTSVNSKTGAVTLTASDVGALPDTTTYVSSFNGSTGAVTYTAPVTSVNSKTGAVTLTASDVGALPDTTTIPSKLSDLTNDLIYDLGSVTVNDMIFSVSADDVTAITSLWNNGYCGLKLTVNSKDYYAFKERMITYNSLSFMGFVAVEADISFGIITGKTLVGINSSGIGMFAVISDLSGSDVPLYEQDPIFTLSAAHGIQSSDITTWNGKQDALVSGTNIKTINGNSLLGSGNLVVGGSQPVQEIFIAEYGVTTYADVLSAYNDNKAIFLKVISAGVADAFATQLGHPPSSFEFYYVYSNASIKFTLTSSDVWSRSNVELVPTTRTINSKALSSDITLTASDVGALADTYTAPVTSVNSKTGAVTLTASDVGALSSSTTYVSSVNGNSGAITGIQTTGNLVTSVSSASTDTEYPSAKCVYERTTPTVLEACGSGNISTVSGAITQISLVSAGAVYNNTRDAEIDTTLGGIRIKTAGIYKVQGSAYITTGTGATMLGTYLTKSANGGNYASATEFYGGLETARASSNMVVGTPIKMVSCAVDDVIYLAGRVMSSTGTIAADNKATFIHLEKVGE